MTYTETDGESLKLEQRALKIQIKQKYEQNKVNLSKF